MVTEVNKVNVRTLANAIRFLSMDAVQNANSGHPGMPMGMADIVTVLWREFLNHNPQNPNWFNRDRFVLSNGHGSMLLYSMLHLTGYDVAIEDLKNFRQLHSKTPGHPEYGCAPGVETTTGPLGQGFANAVGMALAEKMLAAEFNKPEFNVVDHFTYAFCGDGCLMEGISHEAASLAGVHKLGKLVVFWDDNSISIDGDVDGWFKDDTAKRFEAYGWHVVRDVDGFDQQIVANAIKEAQSVGDKPTLICCKTVIGFGAPHLAGSEKTHGSPLGEEEIAATRKNLNWPYTPFEIPENIYAAFNAKEKGQGLEQVWQKMFEQYRAKYPELAKEFSRRMSKKLPPSFKQLVDVCCVKCCAAENEIATRKASQLFWDAVASHVPELFGGSADLTGSNLTKWQGVEDLTAENPLGRYMHYGVREFAMCAIMNGIALYGGFIPFGGTFLVFSDYARNAIRLAALMKQRVIYVLSHDSVGLGEDGPTHQPIEHLAMLRATPNLAVWRPADQLETAVAWQAALENESGPTALVLTRQKVPPLKLVAEKIKEINRGGYVVKDYAEELAAILIATGSEVQLAIAASEKLAEKGVFIKVVSMPCLELFLQQSDEYKEQVLPSSMRKRIAVEAAASQSWYQIVGLDGKVIGIDRFGESAPAEEIFTLLGFTVENVISEVEGIIN